MKAYLVAAGKFHDIDFARLELLKLLAELPHIRTNVAHDYSDIETICGSQILISYTCDVVPTPAQTEGLKRFLEGGGKWLALHGTNSILRFGDDGIVDCPNEAPAFMDLLGTAFAAHPPIEPYKVHVTRADHPLTAGLRDFNIEDELYLSRRTAEIDVLLHTVFHGACPEFRAKEWKEDQVPVLYLRKVGKGAVLYLTLGHCRGHYDLQPIRNFNPHPQRCAWNYPIYYELLRRALRWSQTSEM